MGTERTERLVAPTMAAAAYTQIKRQIVRLELQPGQEITETELAQRLNMSKTPVREALARLRLEGLVTVIARFGYKVATVTLKDARDLFALRSLLEGEAAALAAANAGDLEHLRELERACQTDYDPADPVSIEAFLVANTAFHMAIAEMSGNQRLVELFHDILQEMERLFHLGLQLTARATRIAPEHDTFQARHKQYKAELVDAIARGDASAARAAAETQAADTQQHVIDALLSSDVLRYTNVVAPAAHPPREKSTG